MSRKAQKGDKAVKRSVSLQESNWKAIDDIADEVGLDDRSEVIRYLLRRHESLKMGSIPSQVGLSRIMFNHGTSARKLKTSVVADSKSLWIVSDELGSFVNSDLLEPLQSRIATKKPTVLLTKHVSEPGQIPQYNHPTLEAIRVLLEGMETGDAHFQVIGHRGGPPLGGFLTESEAAVLHRSGTGGVFCDLMFVYNALKHKGSGYHHMAASVDFLLALAEKTPDADLIKFATMPVPRKAPLRSPKR